MARFDAQMLLQKANIEAADDAALEAAVRNEVLAQMPTWSVANVQSRESAPIDGEWVVARRPDNTEAYALVGTNAQTGQRGVRFGDGLTRGLAAVVRKAP